MRNIILIIIVLGFHLTSQSQKIYSEINIFRSNRGFGKFSEIMLNNIPIDKIEQNSKICIKIYSLKKATLTIKTKFENKKTIKIKEGNSYYFEYQSANLTIPGAIKKIDKDIFNALNYEVKTFKEDISSPLISRNNNSNGKNKNSTNKELNFEPTGTSVDAFLKAAYNMANDFHNANSNFDDLKIYTFCLLTDPENNIGKEMTAIITEYKKSGKTAQEIDLNKLNAKITNKSDIFKELDINLMRKNIETIIEKCKKIINSLSKTPENTKTLIKESTKLPDNLKEELKGLKARKIPKILKQVNQAKNNLNPLTTEPLKLIKNASEVLDLLVKTKEFIKK